MSSLRKKFAVKQPVVVDLGCGCRRGSLTSLFSKLRPSAATSAPSPPPRHRHYRHPLSSYYPFSPSTSAPSSWEASQNPSSLSTTASSLFDDESLSPPPVKKTVNAGQRRRSKGRVGESVAVEKDSDDPFVDFRDSMLQMIMEKEIFAWEDLQDLLHRFLSLNDACHHDVIVRAFYEIWNGVFAHVPAGSGGGRRRRRR